MNALAQYIGLLFVVEERKMRISYLQGMSYVLSQVKKNGIITAEDIFIAVSTYGFPRELIYGSTIPPRTD